MAENVYEGLFILDSNRYGRDPAAVSGRIVDLIKKQGGTILVSRLWEERRLAYVIRGQRKGTYWLTYFRVEGEKIAPLNEQANRDDNLLRHMIVKIDPRVVDALVSHAQQTTAGAATGATGAAVADTPSEAETTKEEAAEPASVAVVAAVEAE